MSVLIEFSPDMLAWKVVRTRKKGDEIEYLTADSWKLKHPTEQIIFDETMLWESDDIKELGSLLKDKL